MASVLLALDQLCYFVCLFRIVVTNFEHKVAATISYDRNELLDIRTAITHLELDKDFSLMSLTRRIYCFPRKGTNPRHPREEKKRRKRGREGCLVSIRRRVSKPPPPSVLLTNVQLL